MWAANGEDLVESSDGDLDISLTGLVSKGFTTEWGTPRSLVLKFKSIISVSAFEFGSILAPDGRPSLSLSDAWAFLCSISLSLTLSRGTRELPGRAVISFRSILATLSASLDEPSKCTNAPWEGAVKLRSTVGLASAFNPRWFQNWPCFSPVL